MQLKVNIKVAQVIIVQKRTHIYKVFLKNSFTTLEAYINLFRGHVQCLELSLCSESHLVLPEIVMVQCDFYW
jgi:hypothetical protein